MKILFATGIYPPEIGGPATFVVECAEALHDVGHEIEIVTYGDRRTVLSPKWKVWVVPRFGGVILRYLRYAWRVFLQARKADVVFIQGAVSEGFPATIGAWLAGTPCAMRVPGDYAWEIFQGLTKGRGELLDEFVQHRHSGRVALLERLERWTSRRAKLLIVPSAYLKKIVTAWGVAPENIHVVYSTIAPLPSIDQPIEHSVNGAKVLLTVVRAVPWKGVDFLLEVLETLPNEFSLVIVGDGPSLAEWKTKAVNRRLDARCRFLGRADRQTVARWYAMADAFVLASGYEGFPHVVPEAVSFGLPCVVSDCGGNPETKALFPHHVRVAPYKDHDAWREALLSLPGRQARIVPEPFSSTAHRIAELLKSI